MTTLISSSTPIARKDHKCNYCRGIIKKGEKYQRDFLKYDGVYSWKSHLRCQSIASKLNMFDDCDEGVADEDFYEYIKCEYAKLYEKLYPETYETDSIPNFFEQLTFVQNHHLNII